MTILGNHGEPAQEPMGARNGELDKPIGTTFEFDASLIGARSTPLNIGSSFLGAILERQAKYGKLVIND